MNEFPPFQIYQNLREYFSRRGLQVSEAWADRDRFTMHLEQFEYFRVDAFRPDRNERQNVAVFILATGKKYANHAPDFRNLLARLGPEEATKAGKLGEVIVIAEEEFFTKKNMLDAFREFRDRVRGPEGVTYLSYPYHVFALVAPDHVAVPRHSILPRAEVDALLRRHRWTLADLPGISSRDPPVAWLGGRPGQVVKIERASETAGVAIFYRVVKA